MNPPDLSHHDDIDVTTRERDINTLQDGKSVGRSIDRLLNLKQVKRKGHLILTTSVLFTRKMEKTYLQIQKYNRPS